MTKLSHNNNLKKTYHLVPQNLSNLKEKNDKTVIFDMDGVIVDTEPVHRYAYYKQFSELDIEVPEEMYTTFTGFSTRNTFQTLKGFFPCY